MTVAGVIYSSTGGFKFPDNTTQTTAASGGLSGGGTVNYVGKFTGTGTIGNSLIFDNGTNVGIGTTDPGEKLDVQGDIEFGSGNLKLRYKTGVNPTFAKFSISNNWNTKSCRDGACPVCSTAAVWRIDAPTCKFIPDTGNCSSEASLLCVADSWSKAVGID